LAGKLRRCLHSHEYAVSSVDGVKMSLGFSMV
jgi:hypothetical protein